LPKGPIVIEAETIRWAFELILVALAVVLWYLMRQLIDDMRVLEKDLSTYKPHVAETFVTQGGLGKAVDNFAAGINEGNPPNPVPPPNPRKVLAMATKIINAVLQAQNKPAGSTAAAIVRCSLFAVGTDAPIGSQQIPAPASYPANVSFTFTPLDAGAQLYAMVGCFDGSNIATAPAVKVGPFTVAPDVAVGVVQAASEGN
jgi:hypothetical protein